MPTRIIDLVKSLDPEMADKEFPNTWKEICVVGRGSIHCGISDRLQESLQPNFEYNLRVIAAPERRISTWIGGSIYASLTSKNDEVVKKDMYEEHGERILYSKFI